jgi:regulator of sirC expression with transglutaminase-like and TPR domain
MRLLFGVLLACVVTQTPALDLNDTRAIFGEIDQNALATTQKLLDTSEDQVDFAQAKLTIDLIIDPSINSMKETMRLARMVDDVNAMGPFVTSMQKKDALRAYIYEPGEWNRYQSFSYDLSDPRGTNLQSKLLATYMDTRKGNCISMPILFLSLGQKLGLDMTASTAPLHMFVKFTEDETGQTYNLETVSGGNPARDSWLRHAFPMTDLAVQNGLYLQKLTRQETVAAMLATLQQHYMEKKQFGMVILLTEMILDVYPKLVSAIVYSASAFNELLKAHDLWQYRKPSDVPKEKRGLFKYLVSHSNGFHNQAIEMGWDQPSQAEEEAYTKRVQQAAMNN